jgi:hypothetical protein
MAGGRFSLPSEGEQQIKKSANIRRRQMRIALSTYVASLTSIKALVRAAALMSTVVTLGLGSIGLSAPGLVGAAGLAITIATPAHANCLMAGTRRDDISDDDCLEAQRTGCIRSKLNSLQYTNCLAANQNKRASCVLAGTVRDDLSAEDCEEAKATGCVRRLLSTVQYKSCLDAQPVRR